MKPVLAILIATASSVLAASPVGLLPQDKSPVVVEANERNPFGKKTAPVAAAAKEVTEESKIRGVLKELPVAGFTESTNGLTVMLGPVVIQAGRTLRPIIPNQTEILQVLVVEPEEMELAFVEKNGKVGTRRFKLPIKKAPEVRFRVGKSPKTAEDGAEKPDEFDGVMTKDEIAGQR
jgi:hypothetical protein